MLLYYTHFSVRCTELSLLIPLKQDLDLYLICRIACFREVCLIAQSLLLSTHQSFVADTARFGSETIVKSISRCRANLSSRSWAAPLLFVFSWGNFICADSTPNDAPPHIGYNTMVSHMLPSCVLLHHI